MLLNAFNLYLRYIAISIRGQMQYRASLVMQAIGALLITGIEFVGVWALFDRFGSLRNWSLAEVALIYGMVDITFAISDAVARGFDVFSTMVVSGDFDRLLLRPRSTVLQLAGHELTLRRIGRLLQGLAIFLWAASALDLNWSAGRIALLLFAVAGGVCLFWGLLIVQATIAFWTVESLEVMNSFTYGGVATAQFPMSIYRPWFRSFFTFVIPLACVTYFPAVAILGKHDPLGTPRAFQHLAPLAGFAFFALSLQLWKLGVRHYVSTGS